MKKEEQQLKEVIKLKKLYQEKLVKIHRIIVECENRTSGEEYVGLAYHQQGTIAKIAFILYGDRSMDDPLFCENCGNQLKIRYALFCKKCGFVGDSRSDNED